MTTTLKILANPGDGLVARVVEQRFDADGRETSTTTTYLAKGDGEISLHVTAQNQVSITEIPDTRQKPKPVEQIFDPST